MPNNTHSKAGYPALTGIRALGAAVVFFIHLSTGFALVNVLTFFFVLSGFLIVYIYYDKITLSRQWLASYFVNRFARIYPVYFLLVTVAILLKQDFRPVFLFKNYTLTHALFNNLPGIAIQPTWSLTVEECFYLLAPAIIWLTRRYGIAVPLLLSACMLIIALQVAQLPLSLLHGGNFVFFTTYFGYFFVFFAGAYLALVMLRQQQSATGGIVYTTTGTIAIAALILLLTYTNQMHPVIKLPVQVFINNFLLGIPIAIFYYGLMRETTIFSRLLSTPLLQLLGKSSYAFYVLHMLVIQYLAMPFIKPAVSNVWLYGIISYLITVACSIAIFVCYEQPLNQWIRNWHSRRVAARQGRSLKSYAQAYSE